MGLLDDLDRRRETAARNRENSGRLAQAYFSFTSTGQGTLEYEERVDFGGVIFTELPYVEDSAVVDTQVLKELVGRVAMPQCTGYVTEWDSTEKEGFYSGCWVAVRVDFPLVEMLDYTLPVVVDHHFTFTGNGIKDIEPELSV